MPSDYFIVLIDNRPTRFEKNRIISIDPHELGTKILLEASHVDEEPIQYFTSESYENVIKSYLK